MSEPRIFRAVVLSVVKHDYIARGMAAPGLLAQIIVAKYADHCPLYRQQGIYRRSGVELDRATLAAWVGETARLLDEAGLRG